MHLKGRQLLSNLFACFEKGSNWKEFAPGVYVYVCVCVCGGGGGGGGGRSLSF